MVVKKRYPNLKSRILTIAIAIIVLAKTSYSISNVPLQDYPNLDTNQMFQNMDNMLSIGYGYTHNTAYNSHNLAAAEKTQFNSINLHLEELFSKNFWLAIDGGFTFKANSNSDYVTIGQIQYLGIPANLTGKAGYSINSNRFGIAITPYLSSGIILNYNLVTIPNNGFSSSYYTLYGGGARIEYIPVSHLSIFFDQLIGYLYDNASSNLKLNAIDYNSTIGIKYNITNHLQTNIQAGFNQITILPYTINSNNIGFQNNNNNQTSYTIMASVAYLFNKTDDHALHNYFNQVLAKFDNTYSIGYGIAASKNAYSSGVLPTINGSNAFLNVEFMHLFDNNIWTRINGEIITHQSQSNTSSKGIAKLAPTYIGTPGSANINAGYAITSTKIDAQIIPYLNAGIIANINAYNAEESAKISYILAHDFLSQYGAGFRTEYAVNSRFQLYFDQLFAKLNDYSIMGLRAWRSTSTVGGKFNITKNFWLGLNSFYDSINPTSTIYNPAANINYAAKQTVIGGLLSIGVNY